MSDSGILCPVTIVKLHDTPDSLDGGTATFLSPLKQPNSTFSLLVDHGIEYQQDLTARKLAIIILHAKSNRLKDLLPLVPACLARIKSIQPGQIVTIVG